MKRSIKPQFEPGPSRVPQVFTIAFTAIFAALITGCVGTRSISNSGYNDAAIAHYNHGHAAVDPAFAYRGELNEFDVLGISRGATASDTEIERALDAAKRIRLRPGSSILLIQSGAAFPDGTMVAELSKHFRVVPFSGIPPASRVKSDGFESVDAGSYSRSLRLAAARGGNDAIVCYWGILESATADLPTKTISWVPVVNWMLPDERLHMRITLKIAVVNVRTGDWAVLSPEPIENARTTLSPRRAVTDQKLVETLKEKAYVAAVHDLVFQYAAVASRD